MHITTLLYTQKLGRADHNTAVLHTKLSVLAIIPLLYTQSWGVLTIIPLLYTQSWGVLTIILLLYTQSWRVLTITPLLYTHNTATLHKKLG